MLLPNLFQLCGPCYGSHQNVYALSFPNKQELILFDTGLDETDRRIIGENLSVWGLDAYKICCGKRFFRYDILLLWLPFSCLLRYTKTLRRRRNKCRVYFHKMLFRSRTYPREHGLWLWVEGKKCIGNRWFSADWNRYLYPGTGNSGWWKILLWSLLSFSEKDGGTFLWHYSARCWEQVTVRSW